MRWGYNCSPSLARPKTLEYYGWKYNLVLFLRPDSWVGPLNSSFWENLGLTAKIAHRVKEWSLEPEVKQWERALYLCLKHFTLLIVN